MAHQLQLLFMQRVRDMFPASFEGKRVLEIGSLDINGGIRRFFHDCDYTGLDVAPGPGVDIVCQGQEFDAPDASFDTVVSCEVMEHNPYWKETFANMFRLCRPGGLIVMTCATTGRAEHGTARSAPDELPLTVELGWNYYRNLTAADFRHAVDLRALVSTFGFFTTLASNDLNFAGFRRGASPPEGAAGLFSRAKAYHTWRNLRTIVRWIVRGDADRLKILLRGEPEDSFSPLTAHATGAARCPPT